MAFGNGIFNSKRSSSNNDSALNVKTLVSCGVPPAIANKVAYSPQTLTTAEVCQIKQCLEKTRHNIHQKVGNLDAIIQEFSYVDSFNTL